MVADDATLTVTGGLIGVGFGGTPIVASGNGVIELVGTGFTVNGAPVPYGPLVATTGTIAGTLASGDTISDLPTATFSRDAGGQIVLVPAPPVLAIGMLARSALVIAFALSGSIRQLRELHPPGVRHHVGDFGSDPTHAERPAAMSRGVEPVGMPGVAV